MRVKFQQQCEHSECGLACAAMMIDFFRVKTRLSRLREKYGVPNGGYNLAQLKSLLCENSINTKGARIEADAIDALPTPFIAFWNKKHFIIVEHVSNNQINVVDPAKGKVKMSREEFKENFSEIALYTTDEPTRKTEIQKLHPALKQQAFKNKKLIIDTLVIALGVQCLNLVIPNIIQGIVDNISTSNMFENWRIIAGTLLVILNLFLFNFFKTRIVTKLQTEFDKDLTGGTIKQLLDLPYSYFVNRSKGELIYRINSNSYIRQVLLDQMMEVVIDIMFFFLYLIMMFFYNKILAAFTLGIALILCTLSYYNTKITKKISNNQMTDMTKSQDLVNEMINNIFTIKSTNSQENMFNKWQDNYDSQIKWDIKRANYMAVLGNITTTIQGCYSIFVYIIGYILVCRGQMTLGSVVAFVSIGSLFLNPMMSLMGSYNQFSMVKMYIDQLIDIIDTTNETDLLGKEEVHNFTGEVTVKDVSYRYSKFSNDVISNINLKINPYEKVAIVGSSGSGKSTLLKLMASLYQPTLGELYYDNKEVQKLDIHKLRDNIGVVLQENQLFSGSLRENILMGREFSDEQIWQTIEDTNLMDLISRLPLGLDTILSEGGQNLSGGQRQRISIARTIIANPKIIFLDEPTSALDNESENKVMDTIFNMKTTLVVVAHRLATIKNFDKIIVMDKGKIVEVGTHDELMKHQGYYSRLYDMKND